MMLESVADGDSVMMIDGLRAGRITEQVVSEKPVTYIWTLTSPRTVLAGVASSGEEDTLDGAKAAMRKAFFMWLKWALKQEKRVVWYG